MSQKIMELKHLTRNESELIKRISKERSDEVKLDSLLYVEERDSTMKMLSRLGIKKTKDMEKYLCSIFSALEDGCLQLRN